MYQQLFMPRVSEESQAHEAWIRSLVARQGQYICPKMDTCVIMP